MPKFNMYQSLHTTVIGPEGKPVELQIRTHAMHRRAEYGVAAHWKYKEDVGAGVDTDRKPGPTGSGDMAWLRQLLDWQRETADPGEFLDSLRFEINAAEVYVFTPRATSSRCRPASTPVDFAYAVHTEVGHRCIGARVNGRLVPLESTLDNGDVVEIFTSKADERRPEPRLADLRPSPRARNKIRQWFSKERREEAIEQGKDAIAKAMRKQHLPIQRLMTHESLATLAHEMRYADVSALYAAVGEGNVGAQTSSRGHRPVGGEEGADGGPRRGSRSPPTRARRRPRRGDPGVVVKGVDDVWVKLARCCTPVPGDPIIGFVTRGSGRLGAPRRLRQRCSACRPSPSGSSRSSGRPRRSVFLVRSRSRRSTAPGCCPTSPGCCPTTREHPRGVVSHLPRPGRDLAVHLRDGRPGAPRPRARAPSAGSRASSTPTASPSRAESGSCD